MMRTTSLIAIALGTFLALPALAQAHGPSQGYYTSPAYGRENSWENSRDYTWHHDDDDRRYGHDGRWNDNRWDRDEQIAFSRREEETIARWYRINTYRSPPEPMPRSYTRMIYRSGYLPDGVLLQTLPLQLVRQLGPCPRGYERYVLGRDVILVSLRNGEIIDVMANIL